MGPMALRLFALLLLWLHKADLLLIETPLTLLHEVPALFHEPQRVSGYFDLDSTRAGRMFYWFFESRTMQSTDPLVLWINGGPGLSSSLSVFYENGPYRLDDDLNVRLADWSWDVNHNMIFVDQPINTGFSYTTDIRDFVYDEQQLAEDVLSFLGEFLQEHPDMAGRDFYLAGVSYAGHMVPNIGAALVAASAGGAGLPLHFVGIALGNPLIVPPIQYRYHGEYAYEMGLLDAEARGVIDGQGYAACAAVIDTCEKLLSRDYCARGVSVCSVQTVGAVLRYNPGMNVYDVRKQCEGSLCYDYSRLTSWMEQPEVQETLGVDRPWAGPASSDAHSALLGDWLLSYDAMLGSLLDEGLRVLVYAGKYDQLCNYVGQEAWMDAMPWSGQQEFEAAQHEDWVVNGEVKGSIRSAGLLTLVLMDDAGHYVPMDQPEAAWHLFTRFTRNASLADDSDMDEYLTAGGSKEHALNPPDDFEVSVEDSLIDPAGQGEVSGDDDDSEVQTSIGISG